MKYIPLVWAAIMRKPARAFLTLLSVMVAFMPMVRPNKVKAIITDSKVRMARAGLRISPDQISGTYFMP